MLNDKKTAQFLFEQFFSILSMEKTKLIKSMIPMGAFTLYLYLITLLSWASDTSLSYLLRTNNGGLIMFSFLSSCSVYMYALCFYSFLFIMYNKDPTTQKTIIFTQIKRKLKELFFFQLFILGNSLLSGVLYALFFKDAGFFSLIFGIVVFFIYGIVFLGVLFFNTFGIFIKNKTFLESTTDSLVYTAVYLNIVLALMFLLFILISMSFLTLFLGFIVVVYTMFYLQIKVGIPLAEQELKNMTELIISQSPKTETLSEPKSDTTNTPKQ